METIKKTPVTILTGALGSGKTTLIKNILEQLPHKKILILENEFSEVNIDSKILENSHNELEIIELSNGCICCNIRGELFESLLETIKKGHVYDRVIIECTGVADPAQITSSFSPLSVLSQHFVIDAILCLVDAKNHHLSKNDEEIYQKQIVFSDRLLISKSDLIDLNHYEIIKDDLRNMHPTGVLLNVINGKIVNNEILDLYCYSFKQFNKEIRFGFKNQENKTTHNYKSHVLHFRGYFERSKLDLFLNVFYLTNYGQIVRAKGILCLKYNMQKVFFHAVYDQFNYSLGEEITEGEISPENIFVFIGKDINEEYLRIALEKCMVK